MLFLPSIPSFLSPSILCPPSPYHCSKQNLMYPLVVLLGCFWGYLSPTCVELDTGSPIINLFYNLKDKAFFFFCCKANHFIKVDEKPQIKQVIRTLESLKMLFLTFPYIHFFIHFFLLDIFFCLNLSLDYAFYSFVLYSLPRCHFA